MKQLHTRRGLTQQKKYRSGVNLTISWKGHLHQCWVSTQPIKRVASMGFTLIEMLVVVLIIGILAAVALPQYQKAVRKARLTEIVVFLDALQKGTDVWLLQNGGFPSTETVVWSPTSSLLDIDIAAPKDWNDQSLKCSAESCEVFATLGTVFPSPDFAVMRDEEKGWTFDCIYYEGDDEAKELCEQLASMYPKVKVKKNE